MTELSAFTFSYSTDLTSAVTRTNNQRKGFAEMQSLLLCLAANGNAPHSRPNLRSVKLTNENSTLSETLREGALLLLCIIWVSADYGICQNENFDLCGTESECANRLQFNGILLTNLLSWLTSKHLYWYL